MSCFTDLSSLQAELLRRSMRAVRLIANPSSPVLPHTFTWAASPFTCHVATPLSLGVAVLPSLMARTDCVCST